MTREWTPHSNIDTLEPAMLGSWYQPSWAACYDRFDETNNDGMTPEMRGSSTSAARSLLLRVGVCLLALLPLVGCAKGEASNRPVLEHDASTDVALAADASEDTVEDQSTGPEVVEATVLADGCVLSTCELLGATCGKTLDGCGGTLDCGTCPEGENCGGGGTNRCGAEACTPRSCDDLGISCGLVSDDCSDVLNCGQCLAPETCGGGGVEGQCGCGCALSHAAESACAKGACTILSCEPGWADCDAKADNGCEANTGSDPANCGACGKGCFFAHASAQCTSGACALGDCEADYKNCDADPANGCETNTQSDPKNCANCGKECSAPTGTAVCTKGVCGISNCPAGLADCDADASNGCEVDTNSSALHCGFCNNSCSFANATAKCVQAICQVDACKAGWGNCDGFDSNGCETNVTSSPINCGVCGKTCPSEAHAQPACAQSNCSIQCDSGWGDCDGNFANGCEVGLSSDPQNCGSCSKHCSLAHATASCSSGNCTVASCLSGYGNCDGVATNGCETNTMTTAAHCGSCTKACNSTQACSAGVCVCQESWTCTAWGTCVCGNTQSRTCTDAHSCGTTASKPAESQTCDPCAGKTSGAYCGATTQFGGCLDTLYTCKNNVTSNSVACAKGCKVMPPGQNDYCIP